jgi:general L-amino acid transport system permease protein
MPAVYLATVLLVFAAFTFWGGVGWGRWGGFLLTLFLAVGGIVLSFPLGVLLALGRRSSFPAVRIVCVGYIELIRGVPLITLLFMGQFILGFFLPPGVRAPDTVTRALIALVLFTAAYIAEIVRGGLQGVPRGQTEAAQAIGLSPVRMMVLIILPQALRNVIPALVGQFISLFKDTSLVVIVGLLDLLRVAQIVTQQPDFVGRGLATETLLFASFVYWVCCYTMSRSSQRLERRLGVGER